MLHNVYHTDTGMYKMLHNVCHTDTGIYKMLHNVCHIDTGMNNAPQCLSYRYWDL